MGKLYYCHNCVYFTAMVEEEDVVGLRSASEAEYYKPDLFVLTHCTNKHNPDESEGNTREAVCPLVGCECRS